MATSTISTPVNCNIDFDNSNLIGKTVIVTGGASGLGEAYVRALVSAKATVYFADLDTKAGEKLASELLHTTFVPCDVTNWDSQVNLFSRAATSSPSGRIDYVVANAGISAKDDVFAYEEAQPTKPKLNMIEVNLHSVMYTTKLALHYFIKQNGTTPSETQQDTCLVLIGSGAAYFDVPRTPQYCASKWAMRGVMHALRRTAYHYGSRVNMISPWYVKTKILSEETFQHVEKSGVQFATVEDASTCLLRILSDTSINGRSLFVSARKWAPKGYLDLNLDDTESSEILNEIQRDQIRSAPVEEGLFLG